MPSQANTRTFHIRCRVYGDTTVEITEREGYPAQDADIREVAFVQLCGCPSWDVADKVAEETPADFEIRELVPFNC